MFYINLKINDYIHATSKLIIISIKQKLIISVNQN